MNRAARVAWPTLTFLLAVLAAVAVAGGIDGPAVGRIIARLVVDAAAAVVLGVIVLVVVALPSGDRRRGLLLDVAAGAAALWAVAAATTVFLLYLGDAPAFSDPDFGPGLVAFVEDVPVGRTWLVAAVLAAVLTAALVAARSRPGVVLVGVGAAAALVPVALQAPMSGDPLALARTLAAAELVQLVGVAGWTGSIVLRLLLRSAPDARRRTGAAALACGAIALCGALLAVGPRLADGTPVGAVLTEVALILVALLVTIGARPRRGPALDRLALPLLGVLAGVAAALDVVRPTDAQPPARTSPAAILTGTPLPAPASLRTLLLDWVPDALWLTGCAVLLVGYVAAVIALRRRGLPWPARRSGAWLAGVVLLGWLTGGGPAAYQQVLVSVHLAQHTALVVLVPLLLAAGAPVRLLAAAAPPASDPPSVPAAVLGALRSPAARVMARPLPATAVAAVVLAGLYGTGLLGWSVTDPVGTEVALAVCLGAGCLLVRAVLSAPRRSGVITAASLLVLEAAGAAAVALGPGLLLAGWFGAMGWGTDALVDQRLGAAAAGVLLVVPTAVLLIAAARSSAGATPAEPSTVNRTLEEVPA